MITFDVEAKNGMLRFEKPVKEDGLYQIKAIPHKNKRSLKQNKYYWGVVIPALMEFFLSLGQVFTQEQAHTQFKDMAGLYNDVLIFDAELSKQRNQEIFKKTRQYKSFSNAGDLTTIDFMNAVDVVRLAIEEYSKGSFTIPEPETTNLI